MGSTADPSERLILHSTMSKSMAGTSNNKWCNLPENKNSSIISTLKHTDPHAVRSRSIQKMVCVWMSIYFETGRSANESNDLAHLAKVLPESYQKSNEFSVNRECGQSVATDDRRTFTDKDKVRRIQTLGNDNKDAMLDCESGSWSGFHQSDDKRKLNCHKLKSSYVTSILITKITFAMFLLKLSTLSAAIFLFVSLVLSLLCVYYIRILCRHV